MRCWPIVVPIDTESRIAAENKYLILGHRELIIYPIDSNGDPPGLWQFIVHLTMNVGHHNML